MSTALPTEGQKATPQRKFETVALFSWAVCTSFVALHAAHRLFLIYLYGFSRFRAEQLYFTEMPKGRDWIVSNGDHLSEGHCIHFLMVLGLWLGLFLVTFRFIYWLLPRRKNANEAQ